MTLDGNRANGTGRAQARHRRQIPLPEPVFLRHRRLNALNEQARPYALEVQNPYGLTIDRIRIEGLADVDKLAPTQLDLHVVIVVVSFMVYSNRDRALGIGDQLLQQRRSKQRIAIKEHEVFGHLRACNPTARQIVRDRIERIMQLLRSDTDMLAYRAQGSRYCLRLEAGHENDIAYAAFNELFDLPLNQRLRSASEQRFRYFRSLRQ